MQGSTTKSAFWSGYLAGLPFVAMALPFAMLFGVVATEAGLYLWQTIAFSLVVIAGAAQFTALQLMMDDAAIGLVLLAALAVNLRMAMYSAALVPHLGPAPIWQRALAAYVNFDQTFMLSVARYEQAPDWDVSRKMAYFMGVGIALAPVWMIATVLGAVVGSAIPEAFALDFIVPIMFLAMVAPALRTWAHVAAAAVSVVVALALIGLPSGTGLLIAAFCAMVAGVCVELWSERRA